MANQEHLDILKQGVEIWNLWRRKHPEIEADLSKASLLGINLIGANLFTSDLREVQFANAYLDQASLSGANCTKANLTGAHLYEVQFIDANLTEANLSQAVLDSALLHRANLSRANLIRTRIDGANLSQANLSGANFKQAVLVRTFLSEAIFSGTELSEAEFGWTTLGNIDLSQVKGLETVKHFGPSTIGIDTIIRSQGKIPESFLRNAGVPDSIIESIPSLVGALRPIDFYSCFISYSSKNQDFAERLYADLQSKGVRCWFAPEDMKIGDKIRARIDETIRIYDKLLLILSEHSIESDWVEFEVETALAKERKEKRTVLFPICLDNTVMGSVTAWAAHIKNTRHIGNFTCWKNHDDYRKAFDRLLRDLKAEQPQRL